MADTILGEMLDALKASMEQNYSNTHYIGLGPIVDGVGTILVNFKGTEYRVPVHSPYHEHVFGIYPETDNKMAFRILSASGLLT